MSFRLSIIVIAKNEQDCIKDCLRSARQLVERIGEGEIVFLDTGSTDKTPEIAKKYADKLLIRKYQYLAYSEWRNLTLKKAKGDWVFYLDADERITSSLMGEIRAILNLEKDRTDYCAYAVPRRNFLLGKELHYGGWWPDYVKRFFRKDKLEGWRGELHEEPVFRGKMGKFKSPLIHLQPTAIEPALKKTLVWSKIEAKALYDSGHPPIVWWRILRMGLTTLFDRLVIKQGFRDGSEGWIESIFQAFHTMIVYMQLWERQNKKEAA